MGAAHSHVDGVLHQCGDPSAHIVECGDLSAHIVEAPQLDESLKNHQQGRKLRSYTHSKEPLFATCESVAPEGAIQRWGDMGSAAARAEHVREYHLELATPNSRVQHGRQIGGTRTNEQETHIVIPSTARSLPPRSSRVLELEPACSALEGYLMEANPKKPMDTSTLPLTPSGKADPDSDYDSECPSLHRTTSPSRQSMVGEYDVKWVDVGRKGNSIFQFLRDSSSDSPMLKKKDGILVDPMQQQQQFTRVCQPSSVQTDTPTRQR